MSDFVFTPIKGKPEPAPDESSWRFQPLDDEQPKAEGYRFTPLETENAKPSILKTVLLENPATAIGETAANLASQGVALPVAGIAGLATEAARAVGLTERTGADVVHAVGGALTYQPRGEFGKAATAAVMYPFEKLAEAGEGAGNRVLDVTGSPLAATAVDTAINSLPMVIAPGIKGAKAAREKFSTRSTTNAEKTAADGTPTAEAQPQAASKAEPQARSQASGEGNATAEFRFTPLDEARNVAQEGAPSRVSNLATDQNPLQQPEQLRMAMERGAGDQGLPGMGGELRGLPAGRGPETGPGALAGQEGRIERLQAGERRLDATEGADTAAAEYPLADRGRQANDATGSGEIGRHTLPDDLQPLNPQGSAGAIADATRSTQPRTARYALIEADNLKASHDVDMKPVADNSFGRKDVARHEQEMAVQGIVGKFEPARLVGALDDAGGSPIVARDGVVEAGQRRAIAIQRVYQANGQKALDYRAHLKEQAPALGLDPASVEGMAKPVLIRLPDEPAPRRTASADFSESATQDMAAPKVQNSWAPGANYAPMVDQMRAPEAKAKTVADLPDPIRREKIVADLASDLGTTIYEGRVKGKNRLGFFRPSVSEVRIKRANDIEVAGHEVAHLLDHRVPEISKAWRNDKALREELKSVSYDQKSVSEGYAEGVRLFLTQPETLEARAPKVSAWLNDFADTHQYGPALRKAQEQMTGWFGQDALNRARSKIGTDKPLAEYFDGFWDKFRQSTVDDLHGVYRMERELTGKINPNGPYESARLSRASASIADGAVRFGHPVKNPNGSVKFSGKGLEEILQPVSKSLDDALLYFVGESAHELMVQKREHLFTRGEIDAMLALKTPERAKAFQEYQAWNKGILDYAEAQGVINPEARRMWQRTQYMPFHRVDQPGGLKGKPGDWAGVQALTGGTTNIKDVLGNMIGNAAMLLDKAVKNEARLKVARLSQRDGGGKFMVKIDTESRPVKISGDQVIEAMLKKYGIAIDGEAPAFFEFLIRGQPPAGNNVVAVLQQGKPVWFEVGDPILYRALKAIDRPVAPDVVRWLGLPKRIGQLTITATPDFWMANIARDTLMGSVMSRSGFRPIIDSIKGMATRMASDPAYKDYLANGGGLSSIFLDEHHFRTKLDKFYQSQGIDVRTVLDTPDKLLTMVETLGDAFEMSTRLGEYKQAIARGEHPRHAAYQGREVSTDFAMRGDSKALGFMYDTVMFLKPALVSWDRLYRGLAHDANKGAIAAKAGTMALLSAGLYLLNRDDPRYQDLVDWDRDANWHFFIGDQHFRWPKIWEIGALSSAAERSTEKIIEADPQGLGKDFARILGATFSINWMPQLAAPLYEQATNRNSFTKSPIETPGMENMQPFLRSKPGTSETMKAVGMATRDLPESLQINPARAEALLRGYFNTYALYGLMLSDQTLFGDKLPEKRADEMPVIRRFYANEPAKHTKYETEFYDLLQESKRLRGTLRELDGLGYSGYADAKEQSPLAGEAKPLEHAAKNLSGINNDMHAVRRDDSLNPAEKRQKLDGLTVERNALLKDAVKASKAAQKERKQ